MKFFRKKRHKTNKKYLCEILESARKGDINALEDKDICEDYLQSQLLFILNYNQVPNFLEKELAIFNEPLINELFLAFYKGKNFQILYKENKDKLTQPIKYGYITYSSE